MRTVVVIAVLALIDCSKKEQPFSKVVDFENVSRVSADLLIEKATPLESDSSELLGEYLRVRYDKEGFFAMNTDRGKGIHHFSSAGKHLGIIAEIGEAPGQVPGISNFKLLGEVLNVTSRMGNSKDLHTFSRSGELLNSNRYPLNAFAFYK
ncbi:hypothetical protein [Algoriphagus resistens]|uniref:hypothetical protein n=1 Tax=Algoriphagus resistens TaxID=1750590 RepID=UPI000716A1C4|nr:hypothetical protein [Algoriphagus resistens]